MEEKEQKNYVIRCGGADAYLTKIEKKRNEAPVYIYGTNDKKKAKRFTKEEAEEIAEKRQAVAVMIRK